MTYYYCCIPKGTSSTRKLRLQDWIRRVTFEPNSTVVTEGDTERNALREIISKLTESDTFVTYDYACLGESFYEAYCNVLEIIEYGADFSDCTLGLFNYGMEDAIHILKSVAGIDEAMHDVISYNMGI